MKKESYDFFKDRLKKLERRRRYFFIKRYNLIINITYFCIAVLSLSVLLYIGKIAITPWLKRGEQTHSTWVSYRKHKVTYTTPGDPPRKLRRRQFLEDGMTIYTGEKGICRIRLSHKEMLYLAPSSIVEFRRQGVNKHVAKTTFFLKQGSLVASNKNPLLLPTYWVETRTARLPALGNDLRIEVPKGGELTWIRGDVPILPKTEYVFEGTSNLLSPEKNLLEKIKSVIVDGGVNSRSRVPMRLVLDSRDYFFLEKIANLEGFDKTMSRQYFSTSEGRNENLGKGDQRQ